jgi:hypothetical protein
MASVVVVKTKFYPLSKLEINLTGSSDPGFCFGKSPFCHNLNKLAFDLVFLVQSTC